MPKPYYEHAGITIFCGDCRELASELPRPDIVVTDPPYASAAATVTTGWGKSKHGGNWGDMSLVALMAETTMTALRWPDQAFWFCDHLAYAALVPVFFRKYQLVQSVVWDRDVLGMGAHFRKQTEFGIYARATGAPETSETKRDIIRVRPKTKRFHPAEKPVELMVEILRGIDAGLVCDPYAGSGTTLLAAAATGRKAIGIEIEEKYCECAALRLSQEVLKFEEKVAQSAHEMERRQIPLLEKRGED